MGVVPTSDALAKAQAASLDLVQLGGDSDPVVCKIMDYGKHLIDIKKKKAAKEEAKAGSNKGDKISSWDGRWRLSGQTTQPDPFPRSRG